MEHTHDAQGCETARVATLKDATNLVRLLAPDDEDMWGGIMVYPGITKEQAQIYLDAWAKEKGLREAEQ